MVSGDINFEEFFFFFFSLASGDLHNSVFLADARHLKIEFDENGGC